MFDPRRFAIAWGLSGMLTLSSLALHAAPPLNQAGLRDAVASKLQTAEQQQRAIIEGQRITSSGPAWLFFTPELRATLSPQFWGDKAAAVSRSSNPKFADPLPAIVDFQTQLKAAGIELWVVPVPAKVVVYPSHCISGDKASALDRIDQSHVEFYKLLRSNGVNVVDLTSEFREAKDQHNASKSPLFCTTDSHWSGAGIKLAAETLAAQIKNLDWYQPLPKTKYQSEPQSVEITGDLALLLNEQNPVREKLNLIRVMETGDSKSQHIEDDSHGPILLLGDSHTLIFHDPTLYAQGSGLADHLALQLGLPMDVIGVRGSGANAARLNWRRRPDALTGKKLVIWCFSMREFTENTDGWRVIPISKR